MLIGLCGPPSAGKTVVADYLVRELGFSLLESPSQLSTAASLDEYAHEEPSGKSCPPSLTLLSKCWRPQINVVIRTVHPLDPSISDLLKRPYFILVYVDAPLLHRFRRAVKSQRFTEEQLPLFLEDHDSLFYATPSINHQHGSRGQLTEATVMNTSSPATNAAEMPLTLRDMQRISRLCVMNSYATKEEFQTVLRGLSFTDSELLRPSWDTYFMSLAKLAAERTNCMKRRVGCVIAKNKRMVASGYNGTPSGVKNCSDGGCPRCNGVRDGQGVGLDLCLCLHAEENAIIEAGRERCGGSTLYTNLFPCVLCSKKIVQAGIVRVVFDKHYATDKPSSGLLHAGGVLVQRFSRRDICEMLSRFAVQ